MLVSKKQTRDQFDSRELLSALASPGDGEREREREWNIQASTALMVRRLLG